MIPVAEPHDFNRRVRIPGEVFLRKTPHPNNEQWRLNSYWRHAIRHLFNAYNGTCAYCASWTFHASPANRPEDGTVDHFVPKSYSPHLAYEWNNYRLCRRRLNERKGNFQESISLLSD